MSFCYGKVAPERRSLELCHKFYSTYEFDEVCTDDELQTKKIIKFRLGGRAHSLTLLGFARRLGLYHADELDEEGFNVYFEGGLRSDEHFNAQEYWLSISREDNLGLSRSHTSTIRSPVLRVIHKMITYGLCQRTTRDLDTTTLRELIDSEGRLIREDPQLDVQIVAIPRPLRASMQDLYDRIGTMECLSTWPGFTMFHYSEPITYLVMLNHSMIGIISSTNLHHRSISSSRMMRMISSVEMT
ncbi:hypothetical protein Tco_0280307 [Tanacetum coccineum]